MLPRPYPTISSEVTIYPARFTKFTAFTVIRFMWVSAKFGTCTVVSVNGTLVENKMRRFKGECEHFSFNKCPIYTHDGASAKFNTNSHETDNSVVLTCIKAIIHIKPLSFCRVIDNIWEKNYATFQVLNNNTFRAIYFRTSQGHYWPLKEKVGLKWPLYFSFDKRQEPGWWRGSSLLTSPRSGNYKILLKGAQVWDFRSLGFSWFLPH